MNSNRIIAIRQIAGIAGISRIATIRITRPASR